MLRRTPIFTAVDPQTLASGLTPDMHPAIAPLWIDGAGVEFIDGKIRHRKSNKRLLQITDNPVRGLKQHKLSNGDIVVWVVQDNILYRWDQFTLRAIKAYAPGAVDDPYFGMLTYGDWLFVNRGVNSVDFWQGNQFDVLVEMPTNARKLLKHLSFILALGTGDRRTGVSWCDANDISQWVPSRTNTAGTVFVEEFDGGIEAGAPLGPVVAVYSQNQMAIISFIGSPYYFGQKVMLSGIGAIGPEAVASAQGMNFGVSRQGIWQTDGSSYRYIDRGRLQNYLQENVNWAMAKKILAVRNDIERTIEFHFPMGDSLELNEGWSYDPASEGFSKIEVSSSFDEELVLGLPLRATATGQVQLLGARNYSTGALLLQTRPMLMQVQTSTGLTDVHFAVSVDEVELLLHTVRNCAMYIGSSNEHNSSITWSSAIPLEQGTSTYKVPAGVPAGTYWHIRFENTETTAEVVEAGELVLEDGEQVVAVTPATAWQFNLQGFMLFGTIEGHKDA